MGCLNNSNIWEQDLGNIITLDLVGARYLDLYVVPGGTDVGNSTGMVVVMWVPDTVIEGYSCTS